MKRAVNKRYSKVFVITITQAVLFIVPIIILMLIGDGTIRFYSILLAGTMACLMISEVIIIFIYGIFKQKNWRDRVSLGFYSLLFMLCFAFFVFVISKYYRDLPIALKGDYTSISGECTHYFEYLARGSHLDVTINGVDFDMSLRYRGFINKGEKYKVVFLPNTKEVITVYSQ